jgi:hypothetical protein
MLAMAVTTVVFGTFENWLGRERIDFPTYNMFRSRGSTTETGQLDGRYGAACPYSSMG